MTDSDVTAQQDDAMGLVCANWRDFSKGEEVTISSDGDSINGVIVGSQEPDWAAQHFERDEIVMYKQFLEPKKGVISRGKQLGATIYVIDDDAHSYVVDEEDIGRRVADVKVPKGATVPPAFERLVDQPESSDSHKFVRNVPVQYISLVGTKKHQKPAMVVTDFQAQWDEEKWEWAKLQSEFTKRHQAKKELHQLEGTSFEGKGSKKGTDLLTNALYGGKQQQLLAAIRADLLLDSFEAEWRWQSKTSLAYHLMSKQFSFAPYQNGLPKTSVGNVVYEEAMREFQLACQSENIQNAWKGAGKKWKIEQNSDTIELTLAETIVVVLRSKGPGVPGTKMTVLVNGIAVGDDADALNAARVTWGQAWSDMMLEQQRKWDPAA